MLLKILSALFPSVRQLCRLRRDVNDLRGYLGGSSSSGDVDVWDLVSYIESLRSNLHTSQEEAEDLRNTLSRSDNSSHLRWTETQRAIRLWQQASGNSVVWPRHSDLCLWLLRRLEALEVVPTLSLLRRDQKKVWWATTQRGTYDGDKNLIRLLNAIRIREQPLNKEKNHGR